MPAEPSEPQSLALAADFPEPTREQWRELVRAVLAKSGGSADADPEQALSSTTYDDIVIKPLYTAEDVHDLDADGRPGRPPYVRGSSADGATGWDVRVRHAGPDAKAVNAAILEDLERGATSIWLRVGEGAVDDLAGALDGVYLDLAPVVLDPTTPSDAVACAHALLGLAEQRGVDPAELAGSLGADPIGLRARTGADADLTVLATLAERVRAYPNLRIATVDATVYHDAGASDAQEVGIATAVGVAYLRALVDAGLAVDDALERIGFRFAVTAEQFPSIAKLRAARRVWGRVAELSGASDTARGQRQHAVTSDAMLTRRDPWVNMLRTTIACFSAAVGGADAITVAPFDSALGVSDTFARRIARNTHAVLHDESSLARVVDAAGGSWFVESLTDQLAEAAWTVFTDIERNGGPLARLDDGTVARFLAQTHGRRADDIAHRRAPITGVSEFAFVGERTVEREPGPSIPDGMLPRLRYAQEFEALRDRSDAAPVRPTVYLATLGRAAQHSARVGFATNLFAAGGIEPVVGPADEFEGGVACLCGPDQLYADEGAQAVATLRERGATFVWLAGRSELDVDGTVFAGCDALDALRRTLDVLEVK